MTITNKYDDVMNRLRMHPVRGGSFKMLVESQLASVERQLGFSLPDDYREFVRNYGFATAPGDLKFRNMDNPSIIESSVDVFYGVCRGDSRDLCWKKEGFGDRLPGHILPVASSPGGLFCLSLGGTDVGRVYWWPPNGGSRDPVDDMELVARSFDDFVNSLVLLDSEAE